MIPFQGKLVKGNLLIVIYTSNDKCQGKRAGVNGVLHLSQSFKMATPGEFEKKKQAILNFIYIGHKRFL